MAEDIFQTFDMLVAVSQAELNTQLRELAEAGLLPTQLFLGRTTDAGGNYVYTSYSSAAEVPKDAPFVAGTFVPQVNIAATGNVINLVLEFSGGEAGFVEAPGPLGLDTYPMAGWVYEVPVDLSLAALSAADLASAPAAVKQQLGEFSPSLFEVSSLFMDFDSTSLMSWAAGSVTPGGPGNGLQNLAQFMQFYLEDRAKEKNPFIIGYAATAKNAQQANPNVPALLQPTGATFTLYKHPTNPDLSSLSFALVTAGGHVTAPGSPPNLERSPLVEGVPAAAIYSHTVLTEPMLVKPVFDQIREEVFGQIQGKVEAGPGNNYANAKTISGETWKFVISNQGGDDTYVNEFAAALTQADASLGFEGKVNVYKENHRDMGFCTAKAWGWANVSWQGTISLTPGGSGLEPNASFKTVSSESGTDENGCAEAFGWLGSIFGGMFDGLTGFLDGGFFSNLFSGVTPIPNIGQINITIGNVGSPAQTGIVLPTGQVFTPQQPQFDEQGNVIVPMTYTHG